MNDSHLRGRAPKKTGGFCWGRVLRDGAVTYRLFRRDQRGVLHCFIRTYTAEILTDDPAVRTGIACEIHRARRALREQVDEIDLELMGII